MQALNVLLHERLTRGASLQEERCGRVHLRPWAPFLHANALAVPPFRCRRAASVSGLADEVVGWGTRRAEERLGAIQKVLGKSPEGFGCYQSAGHALVWYIGKFCDWSFVTHSFHHTPLVPY